MNQNYRDQSTRRTNCPEQAVQLARSEPDPKPSLPQTLLQRGFVHLYAGRLQKGHGRGGGGISLSPNYADGYALAAHVLIYRGRPQGRA